MSELKCPLCGTKMLMRQWSGDPHEFSCRSNYCELQGVFFTAAVIHALNRRAPSAEQQSDLVAHLDVIQERSKSWPAWMQGAEQQQQEPVGMVRLVTYEGVAKNSVEWEAVLSEEVKFNRDRFKDGEPLYTYQQPPAQGEVSLSALEIQAQQLGYELVKKSILELLADNVEKLRLQRQHQVQGEPFVYPPLQWSGHLKPNEEIRYDHLLAQTPFGRILITWKGWKEQWDMVIDEHPVGTARGCYAGSTIEEAIETAKQKYLEALRGAGIEQPRAAVPYGWEVEAIQGGYLLKHSCGDTLQADIASGRGADVVLCRFLRDMIGVKAPAQPTCAAVPDGDSNNDAN